MPREARHITRLNRQFLIDRPLEATNVEGERLISLIVLIAIAYTAATLKGQKIKQLGIDQ
jgi:hypothetical protein